MLSLADVKAETPAMSKISELNPHSQRSRCLRFRHVDYSANQQDSLQACWLGFGLTGFSPTGTGKKFQQLFFFPTFVFPSSRLVLARYDVLSPGLLSYLGAVNLIPVQIRHLKFRIEVSGIESTSEFNRLI
jgi:hypothetical protein